MARLVVSYSHADDGLRGELKSHFALLIREGVVEVWDDHAIDAGSDWEEAIREQLETADIFLLLISADFLSSEYCYSVEMTRALERHDQGSACVIPVILRPCDWHAAPFSRLQAVPRDGKPVVEHGLRDRAYLEVVVAVRRVVERRAPTKPLGDGPSQQRSSVAGQRCGDKGPVNFRLPRRFSDHDCLMFLEETFAAMSRYFEESLQTLEAENSGVRTALREIDSRRFEARAFVDGRQVAQCSIWFGERLSGNALLLSLDELGTGGWNESMAVEDDGRELYWKPMGMPLLGGGETSPLTAQGAVEYFWSLFLDRLQGTARSF